MKLLFYNSDLTPWLDYVIAADYLKIERQKDMDELQVKVDAYSDDTVFRLLETLCCLVIEERAISMWIMDHKSIRFAKERDIQQVGFTLYEPLFLFNRRAANRQRFSAATLKAFTESIISGNTTGARGLGTVVTSALASLPATYTVTQEIDGEYIGELLSETYAERNLKLYFTMDVSAGIALTAGVQRIVVDQEVLLSPILRNMTLNAISVTNEFGAVYVSGEYQQSGGAPVPLRGYYTLGSAGILLEEHFTQSNKSSDGMTREAYQAYLNNEAQRIAKRRTVHTDISTITKIIEKISVQSRYNRAGVVFPADIGGRVVQYMIDEVKTTPNGISFGVSEYKE